jgi:hypothetical protein
LTSFVQLTINFTEVFTDTDKPIPWCEVVGKPTLYLDPTSLPKGFILRDPSHMRTKNVNELWAHWEARKAARKPLVIFMSGKISDMSKKQLKNAVPYKGKTTMEYIEINTAKTSSTTGAAGAHPTPRTKGPAETDTSEDESAGAAPMPRTKRPAMADCSEDEPAGAVPTPHRVKLANADSSEDESAAAAPTGHAPKLASRPQPGSPGAVSIKGRIQFLKSLSNNNEYLLLVEVISSPMA